MLHTPFFKLLATITLLLGILAAGIHSASHLAFTLRLPYPEADRLVVSSNPLPYSPGRDASASFSYRAWKDRATSFDGMAAYHLQYFYLQNESGSSERLRGSRVSPDFFPLLAAKPLLGRVFSAEDAVENARLVILSHAFWEERYHSSAAAIGSTLWLDGAEYGVAGVMPADFWFVSRRVNFWVLLPAHPNYLVTAVARLKPGFTSDRAQTEARNLEQSAGAAGAVRLLALRDTTGATVRAAWRVVWIAIAIVVLIGLAYLVPLLRSGNPRKVRLKAAAQVWLFYMLKVVLGLLPLVALWLFLAGRVAPADAENIKPFDALFLMAWPFFLAACGVVGWALLDQSSRCPLCLSRFRMPLESGSWAKLGEEGPGTEYICPYGHGKLYVPGTHRIGNTKRRWTSYRDMWQSLFSSDSESAD